MSSPAAYITLYATLYGAFGVASPFWPRFFESKGLTHQEIGSVLAAGLLLRLAAGPMVGRLADRWGRLRAILAVCLALAAAASVALVGARGFLLILVLAVAQAGVLAPTTSIADALAVSTDPPRGRKSPFEYGRLRGTASLAFVFGTLLAGQLIAPEDLTPAIWANAILLLAAAMLSAVPARGPPVKLADNGYSIRRSSLEAVRTLFGLPSFRGVIAVSALVYGSHAMYDAFAVIRWNDAGLQPTAISLLWSEAVGAEVIVFLVIGPRLIDRLGPRGAVVLAASAGIVRWSVLAFTSSPIVLPFLQPLHGLTFALLHLACMRVMAHTVPAALAATAQALYAFTPAMLTALLLWGSGWFYGSSAGAGPFLSMAALCAAAVPFAWTWLDSRK